MKMTKNLNLLMSYRVIIPVLLCVGIGVMLISVSMTELSDKLNSQKESDTNHPVAQKQTKTKVVRGLFNFIK